MPGRRSFYARMPAAQDMIGLYFCVGNTNLVPPWGGTEVLLSTIPSRSPPRVAASVDRFGYGTTNTAFGKIRLKAQRNEPMPEGWMIDRQGQPLTDPKRAT